MRSGIWPWFCGLALSAAVLSGCGPGADQKDLGTLIYHLPNLPGSDKPYPLPPLKDSDQAAAQQPEQPPLQAPQN